MENHNTNTSFSTLLNKLLKFRLVEPVELLPLDAAGVVKLLLLVPLPPPFPLLDVLAGEGCGEQPSPARTSRRGRAEVEEKEKKINGTASTYS